MLARNLPGIHSDFSLEKQPEPAMRGTLQTCLPEKPPDRNSQGANLNFHGSIVVRTALPLDWKKKPCNCFGGGGAGLETLAH